MELWRRTAQALQAWSGSRAERLIAGEAKDRERTVYAELARSGIPMAWILWTTARCALDMLGGPAVRYEDIAALGTV
eukprot:2317716-Alexandrium_andersonii.AAC.1